MLLIWVLVVKVVVECFGINEGGREEEENGFGIVVLDLERLSGLNLVGVGDFFV